MLLRPNTRSCAEKQVVSQPQWYGSDQIPWNIQWDIPWNIYICTAMNMYIYIYEHICTAIYIYMYTAICMCIYIYMSRFLNISLKLI